MTKTRLENWTEEEYRQWSEKHPDEAETRSRNRDLKQEVRADFNSGVPKIVGYAAIFNSETELYPNFYEEIAPGAFKRSIQDDQEVVALINHSPSLILGRRSAGTLKVWEDSKGLGYEVLSGGDRSYELDLIKSLKRGDIKESSFAFDIVEQKMRYDSKNGTVHRRLIDVELHDVSPVTYPAYSSTEVHVRMTGKERSAGDEVIEASAPDIIENPISDEELFRACEDALPKGFRR